MKVPPSIALFQLLIMLGRFRIKKFGMYYSSLEDFTKKHYKAKDE